MTTEKNLIGVTIIGGTGYGAGELLRLLTFHPLAKVRQVISGSAAGKPIDSAHPHLKGFYQNLLFTGTIDPDLLKDDSERFVITALPHEAAGEFISEHGKNLIQLGVKIIDLSGAYRLKDLALHQKYYPIVNRGDESFLNNFSYGLTECFGPELLKKPCLANPGCLATACILSVAPIATIINPEAICFDTKTGSSGSGRELKESTHHPTRHGDFVAYKPLHHQHEPEVMQALNDYGLKEKCEISFAAQSMPVARGIYVTTHIINKEPVDLEKVAQAFASFTENTPFIRLRSAPPHLQQVVGTNYVDLFYAVRGRTILVMTAIDNLVKGMAGQGIQNMNLMAGLKEETGLLIPGMRPY
jgi:N-acetyl-gamma-glutamyl-phosphate/LysW-gamma-L-alpha-aminoadipyl-6-phosphate reductase